MAAAPKSRLPPAQPPPSSPRNIRSGGGGGRGVTSPSTTDTPPRSPVPPSPNVSLQPSQKRDPSKSLKLFRLFRSVFRSFPIITPTCKVPVSLQGSRGVNDNHIHGGTRMTGTLFGYRKARINFAVQETSRCLPMFLVELAIPTGKLLQEMGSGLVRIALECEKSPGSKKTRLMDEPVWSLYCNGRKMGYGVKREATDEDLKVMQMLHAVSMGAGVLPSDQSADTGDGELTYMRAHFERVVGSRDSESYYMMNPDGNNGPELSIFFIRI